MQTKLTGTILRITPTLGLLLAVGLTSCKPREGTAPPHVVATSNHPDIQSVWKSLALGIELGKFPAPLDKPGEITIVRLDPQVCQLRLLACAELGHAGLPADQWAAKYGLSVVINAGMFDPDHFTHTGYMKNHQQVKPASLRPDYSSIAVFSPLDPKDPPFRLLDTDGPAWDTNILTQYGVAMQNLRLIKNRGENRWKPQPKAWSEAALGEDATGHMLLIFCPVGITMFDFNEHLLQLPIQLVAAQHLEGGPEASLYVKCGNFEFRGMGSYETGFNENDDNHVFWDLPNIIGVESRRP
jgi:hypothetical protein